MKQLLETIVKYLVDHPDQVKILHTVGDQSDLFEVVVDKADIGKVIGRGGRIAEAIRTLASAAAFRSQKKHIIQINDNGGARRPINEDARSYS